MTFARKYLPPILAVALGIANGVYVFGPSIAEQKQDAIQSTITPQSPPVAAPIQPLSEDAVSSGSKNKGQ
ncbi:hypothetical protein BR93DRAFT_927560 [Coniochaeta sp. PMI_546]|nr:hypothetical protein BR93DRAFT_927560 [Coniochaeta sp. PMI_546]